MPLPLPSLDTRRWSDLIAEGRALIPRHAPTWTDHNVHDPGIMLMELFAWLSEQLIYRANRIPERHLRKFLALAGFPPAPPLPARVVLAATLPPASGPVVFPAALLLRADATRALPTTFRAVAPVALAQASLVSVQGYDGTRFTDLTRQWLDGVSLTPMGEDPRPPSPYNADRAPALYLGFDVALASGQRLHLYVWGVDEGSATRQRLTAEQQDRRADCLPPRRCPPCETHTSPCADSDSVPSPASAPAVAIASTVYQHHSVRVQWEVWGAVGWEPTTVALDETRGLTLDGSVIIELQSVTVPRALGLIAVPRHWLRCRLVSGQFDDTPTLRALAANAIVAEQRVPAWRRYTVAATAAITGVPVVGPQQAIDLTFDVSGAIITIAVQGAPSDMPLTRVLEYTPPIAPTPGVLTLELERLDPGLGFPNQVVNLSVAPVVADTLVVRSTEPAVAGVIARRWLARDDLDAAGPTDASVAVDHAGGVLTFGSGVRGRLVPEGATIAASYESTSGAAGNVAATRAWSLTDDAVNRAIAGAGLATLSSLVFTNPVGAVLGADAEDVGDALERATSFFWSHERLVELADGAHQDTLDQIDPRRVLALEAPLRATTTLDYERIARDVPGTRVARARAFAGLDVRVSCLDAPGTVTLVIVPHLPANRPAPSRGLVRAVRTHLEPRRILTTRLLVVGPSYVDVGVEAAVRALDDADPQRVQQDIVRALDDFLHPLHGGPAGLGWPFGRDVYRSEILATIDGVEGVDHVVSATLTVQRDGVSDNARCGNVCVPPTYLVAPLPHSIEMVTA